jgi:DNA-binding beta-propeller fold protein YncE
VLARTIALPGVEGRIDHMAYAPGLKRLYVAALGNGSLEVIDIDRGERIKSIAGLKEPQGVEYVPATGQIIVTGGGGGSVVVVDGPNRAITATWTLKESGRNFPMALDATHHRLYIGGRRPAKLVVIDTESGRVNASPGCVGDADDIFLDAKTGLVLVTGGDGTLDVFAADDHGACTRTGAVSTAPGARTSLLVPETRTLFVGAPKRGGTEARVLVYTLPD